MSDVLARGVIEIGIDEIKLQDEIKSARSTLSKEFNASLQRTKMDRGEREKLAKVTKDLTYMDLSRVKMQSVAAGRNKETIKQSIQLMREYGKEIKKASGGGATFNPNKWHTMAADGPMNISQGLGRFASGVGASGAAAAGLTYAGAAMAGSTTMDTLTGSLKMLSLAAGTKTQAPVLAVARGLQKLAKAAEEAPNGAVGAAGGAMAGMAVGARFGGPWGALAGAAIGGIGGGVGEKAANDFADKRAMVSKLKSDPNQISKLLNEINDLEAPWYSGIPFIGNSTEIAKRRGAIRTAEARNKIKDEDDDFKMAGLNMQMTSSGLSSAYDQGNLNMMGMGEQDVAIKMKELMANVKALESQARSRTSVDPNFVGPPQGN